MQSRPLEFCMNHITATTDDKVWNISKLQTNFEIYIQQNVHMCIHSTGFQSQLCIRTHFSSHLPRHVCTGPLQRAPLSTPCGEAIFIRGPTKSWNGNKSRISIHLHSLSHLHIFTGVCVTPSLGLRLHLNTHGYGCEICTDGAVPEGHARMLPEVCMCIVWPIRKGLLGQSDGPLKSDCWANQKGLFNSTTKMMSTHSDRFAVCSHSHLGTLA